MEALPIHFCSSVCKYLEEGDLQHLENGHISQAWTVAAAEMLKHRVELWLHFGYVGGVWKCNPLKVDHRAITIDQLNRIDRRHLQITEIQLENWAHGPTKSLDEILEIMTLTHRYLLNPYLLIDDNADEYSEEALSRILTFYRNTDFISISTSYNHNLVENFLIHQMQTNTSLKKIFLLPFRERFSEDVRVAIEDFALTRNCTYLCADHKAMLFDRTFFERFFDRTMEPNSKGYFEGTFSFEFAELWEFKPELHIALEDSFFPSERSDDSQQFIIWRRPDGVQVAADYDEFRRGWNITIQSGH